MPHKKIGNYIRVDTDFILKDDYHQLRRQLRQLFFETKIRHLDGYKNMATESQFRGRLHASYSLKFKGEELKCSYAAFGEQNKTDNDSKCQLVYKSQKITHYATNDYVG